MIRVRRNQSLARCANRSRFNLEGPWLMAMKRDFCLLALCASTMCNTRPSLALSSLLRSPPFGALLGKLQVELKRWSCLFGPVNNRGLGRLLSIHEVQGRFQPQCLHRVLSAQGYHRHPWTAHCCETCPRDIVSFTPGSTVS